MLHQNKLTPLIVAGLHFLVDAMLQTGFTEDEIGKIGGGNFCWVFDAATNS